MKQETNSLMPSAEYFAMYMSEEKLWWYVGLRDVLLHFVKKYAKKSSIILDAGCGTGKNMHALIQEGFTVKGIDLSDDALMYTRMRGIKSVKKGSTTDIPFHNKTFDMVISTDVFGIFKSDEQIQKAVDEFWRVLKPGGYLLLHCSALPWLYSQHDAYINFKKRFYKKELEGYVTKEKWKIQKSTYRIFFMLIPVALVKLLKQGVKGKKPKSDQYVPPGIFNWIFLQLQLAENELIERFNFPIGTSIFIVAQKRKATLQNYQ